MATPWLPLAIDTNIKLMHSAFHSGQVLSPSKTGFIASAHKLINITLLTLWCKLVLRAVVDLYRHK